MAQPTTPEGAHHDPARDARRGVDPQRRLPTTTSVVAPWFAFLGGAAAWVLQFVVIYSISEIGCQTERLDVVLLGLPGPAFFAFALTLLAGLTAVAAAVMSFRAFPNGVRADPVDGTGAHETPGRRRFMAYAGVIMNGMFLITILATGLPFMFLRSCG